MDFQDILNQTISNSTQSSIYTYAKDYLQKAIYLERSLIQTSQKILYDEEQTEIPRQTIDKLYSDIFDVQYIGEIPTSAALKKYFSNNENNSSILKQNNSVLRQISQISIQKQNKIIKKINSEVKLLDRVYNRKYYDKLQIKQGRSIYKSKCNKKYFIMDVDSQQHWPNKYAIKLLFTIYTSNEREQFTEHLMNLAEMFIFSFENKVLQYLHNLLKRDDINLNDILIEGDDVLSLLMNRLYNKFQRINLQHRQLLYSLKSFKPNYINSFFISRNLTYNNLGYYLDDNLKYKIVQNKQISFQEYLSSLSFYEEEIMEIIKRSKTNGFYQPASKKWKIIVNHSLDTIQFVFHTDMSQVLGSKEKDQRAVLDLYAMAARKSDGPLESIRNISGKNVKSQLNIPLPKGDKDKQIIQEFEKTQSEIKQYKQFPTLEFTDVSSINYEGFQFNILDFDVTETASLAFQLLSQRFVSTLGIKQNKLGQFIKQISINYDTDNNAFHNIYHAFTVLHGAYIVSKGQIFQSLFDEDTTLTYLVAAYCHDVCHTGVTNFFQEKIVSKLANRFGDISILQNNSIATTFKILAKEEADFMYDFPQKIWKNFRKLFVESILATDNKNHLNVLTNFESAMNEKRQTLQSEDVCKLIGGLLHTVDFWGTIKDFKLSYAWSKMINIQFDQQFKKEEKLQIEQTPYFKDLDKIHVIAKNQQVFISAIVLPLYKKVNEWNQGGLSIALKRIDENIVIWKKLQNQNQNIQQYL